jgi:diamine N-acetyltransferase
MPKRQIAPLVSGRVRLRLLEEADLPMTRAWRNQDHIRKWFFNSDLVAPERHEAWWRQYRDRDDDFVFIIEETEALKRPVGQVALYNIDWAARRAEFGRLMIGEVDAQGRGFARLATATVVAAALTAWDFDEVYLEVLEANLPALAIYRGCGFHELGRRDGVVRMEKRP